MSKHYFDYVWKQGIPHGIKPYPESSPILGTTYKIVSDPYRKRNSIEEYDNGNFLRIVYDSALFDFRQIKLGEQTAWQKTTVSESDNAAVCHLRNQDDRLVLVEKYTFENNICRECRAFAPQGNPISIQRIYYVSLGDTYNGAALFDSNEHLVMSKKYRIDEASGEFTELLEQHWE